MMCEGGGGGRLARIRSPAEPCGLTAGTRHIQLRNARNRLMLSRCCSRKRRRRYSPYREHRTARGGSADCLRPTPSCRRSARCAHASCRYALWMSLIKPLALEESSARGHVRVRQTLLQQLACWLPGCSPPPAVGRLCFWHLPLSSPLLLPMSLSIRNHDSSPPQGTCWPPRLNTPISAQLIGPEPVQTSSSATPCIPNGPCAWREN